MVERYLAKHFAEYGERLPPAGLYDRVIREVERPLVAVSLAAARGNQIRAAQLLGLNRNTLRKKIRELGVEVIKACVFPEPPDNVLMETFETMVREAAALRRASRVPEAIAAYRRLLARWPDKADSWYNLALLERHAGEFEAALASYQQALDRGVADPEEVHLNRGVIYADHLRRDDAAERGILFALALNPSYVPALVNLANLREDQGKRDDARALYERAVALAPHSGLALARLRQSQPSSGRRCACGPPAWSIVRCVTPAAHRRLGLRWQLLDGFGAYDEAFAAYQVANRASRELRATGLSAIRPRCSGTPG